MKPHRVELRDANAFVETYHRHHKPVLSHRFSVACARDGQLCGVAICGRPVARGSDQKLTLEILRVCTNGTSNACSFLIGQAVRIARELAFTKVQTYLLENETGVSLRAAGFELEALTKGGAWVRADGAERRTDQPTCPKQRWVKYL